MKQGRLACTGGCDEGHDLARLDCEIGAAQHVEKAVPLRVTALDL
jgi:hypothetical protein